MNLLHFMIFFAHINSFLTAMYSNVCSAIYLFLAALHNYYSFHFSECQSVTGDERRTDGGMVVAGYAHGGRNQRHPSVRRSSPADHAPFSPKFLMGFCSDGPCECTGQI